MCIEENVADRKAAEALVGSIVGDLLACYSDDFKKLSERARLIACKMLHDRFATKLALPCGKCSQAEEDKQKRSRDISAEVNEALQQGEGILAMCDDVPERGEEFAMSVAEGVREVMETIMQRGRVTAEQQRALDNWESGVSAWIK